MTGLLAALLLSATTPADPVGTRIAASSHAAQALQGPLDGAWVLRDARGRKLLIFQIVDPVGGGSLSAAWREPGDGGATGYVDKIERTGGGLTLVFTRPGTVAPTRLRLRKDRRGFAGSISEGGKDGLVGLTRSKF